MSLRNFENASLMGKSLKRLKDIKGQPTMVHEIVEQYCYNSAQDEYMQGTCEECRFDNIYNQFKYEENSNEENSRAPSQEENEESDGDKDFVTYQLCVREEGKIKKKTISKPKNEFEVIWKEKIVSLKKHTHRKRKQVGFLDEHLFPLYLSTEANMNYVTLESIKPAKCISKL